MSKNFTYCMNSLNLEKMKLAIISMFIIFSGCLNVINSTMIESNVTQKIGTKIEPYDYTQRYRWNKIGEDENNYEVEKKWKNGCSYAIRIEKTTHIIKGFRFTSRRNMCDDLYVPNI